MFRAGTSIAIAVLLIAAVPIPKPNPSVNPKPQPIQQSGNAQKPAAPYERGTDKAPVVVKMAHTVEGDEQAAKDSAYKAEDARNNRLLTWFNGILAVVAALELIYIVRQESWMKKSVKAAEDAADAAKTATEALPRVERGYVFVSGPVAYNIAYDPVHSEAGVTLVNHGKTPVVLTRVARFFGYLARGAPVELVGQALEYMPIYPEIPLAAGGETPDPLFARGIISIKDYDAATSGEGHFVLIFRVEYTDIFKEPHVTAFCERKTTYGGFTTYLSSELNYRT